MAFIRQLKKKSFFFFRPPECLPEGVDKWRRQMMGHSQNIQRERVQLSVCCGRPAPSSAAVGRQSSAHFLPADLESSPVPNSVKNSEKSPGIKTTTLKQTSTVQLKMPSSILYPNYQPPSQTASPSG